MENVICLRLLPCVESNPGHDSESAGSYPLDHMRGVVNLIGYFFSQYRNQILYLVESFQTVIIVGETGSGKTTQVISYADNWI